MHAAIRSTEGCACGVSVCKQLAARLPAAASSPRRAREPTSDAHESPPPPRSSESERSVTHTRSIDQEACDRSNQQQQQQRRTQPTRFKSSPCWLLRPPYDDESGGWLSTTVCSLETCVRAQMLKRAGTQQRRKGRRLRGPWNRDRRTHTGGKDLNQNKTLKVDRRAQRLRGGDGDRRRPRLSCLNCNNGPRPGHAKAPGRARGDPIPQGVGVAESPASRSIGAL